MVRIIKPLKYLLCAIAIMGAVQVSAQEKRPDPEIATDARPLLLTPKDKDFLQLWFYEQVLKMSLDSTGRDDYASLLTYYTYRMSRITLPKYGFTEAEQREEFDRLVRELNNEMEDFLNHADYKIHMDSFGKIEDLVYKKRGWTKK